MPGFPCDSCFKSKVTLPLTSAFLPGDVLIQDKLLTLVKSKGVLFNRYSSVAFRSVVILRNGILLVYEKECSGWTLNLSQMLKLKTTSTQAKKDNRKRIHFDFKADRGTVSMVATGAEAGPWMDVVCGVMRDPRLVLEEEAEEASVRLENNPSTDTLFEEEGIISQIIDDLEENFDNENYTSEMEAPAPRKPVIQMRRPSYSVTLTYTEPKSIVISSDSSDSEKNQQKKKPPTGRVPPLTVRRPLPPSSAIETTEEEQESVRQGEQSVATLRNILEARTSIPLRKTKSLKKAESQLEKKDDAAPARIYTTPGKSHSAPASVTLPKKKQTISGTFDGCFDSVRA